MIIVFCDITVINCVKKLETNLNRKFKNEVIKIHWSCIELGIASFIEKMLMLLPHSYVCAFVAVWYIYNSMYRIPLINVKNSMMFNTEDLNALDRREKLCSPHWSLQFHRYLFNFGFLVP